MNKGFCEGFKWNLEEFMQGLGIKMSKSFRIHIYKGVGICPKFPHLNMKIFENFGFW